MIIIAIIAVAITITIAVTLATTAVRVARREAGLVIQSWFLTSQGPGATLLITALQRGGLIENARQFVLGRGVFSVGREDVSAALKELRVRCPEWMLMAGIQLVVAENRRRVRALYGVSNVTLYRGVTDALTERRSVESWTDSYESAARFGQVETITVSIDRVLFTFETVDNTVLEGEREWTLITEGL